MRSLAREVGEFLDARVINVKPKAPCGFGIVDRDVADDLLKIRPGPISPILLLKAIGQARLRHVLSMRHNIAKVPNILASLLDG